jgi:heat shock protein HtpX
MAGLFLLLWLIVNWLTGVHTTQTCATHYDCETTYDFSIPGLIITALVVAAYLVIGPLLTSRHLVTGYRARSADRPEAAVPQRGRADGDRIRAPSPQALIVDDPALNAYAVADGRRHGAVDVTSGLLAALDRRELSGVVAHEFAHFRNRDSRVMLVTEYAVGAIIVAAEIFVAIAS